jgi:L-threonylcarbamoyladenylate synthase
MKKDWQDAEKQLKNDGVVVLLTDTIYGVVCSAYSKKAVKKLYSLKGRDEGKPCIVLISSYDDLKKFGIKISKKDKEFLEKFWPGKVSVILSCPFVKFSYLHRGVKSIAFRMVRSKNKNLFNLTNKVGPLLAPSANPQGLKPSQNIKEAKKYFGLSVDSYVNSGKSKNKKFSTIVKYVENKFVLVREGCVKITF